MEHRTVSIADQVFEILEKDILTGVHARGEILTETKLSEKLGGVNIEFIENDGAALVENLLRL